MRVDYKKLDSKKVILITGAAGFIGFHLAKRLLEKEMTVIGYDNMNDYYDTELKYSRIKIIEKFNNFIFVKADLTDKLTLDKIFVEYKPQIIVNLAAQAGVRYSIQNPRAYIDSNVIGFFNILEACRHYQVEHLIYASSSSVYGANKKVPFSTMDNVNNPLNIYAATKKSNELMAYSYSHLYGIASTGLRFFTVYGPFGRPDMAYFSFTKAVVEGRAIKIFNNGDMYRDFTYIDDIVTGIENILCNPPLEDENNVKYKIYNIGNNKPVKLMEFIKIIEKYLGKETKKEFLPMQEGDMYQTYAEIKDLTEDFGFRPDTSVDAGLADFIDWYIQYYNIRL